MSCESSETYFIVLVAICRIHFHSGRIRDYRCHYLLRRLAFLDGIISNYQRPSTLFLPWFLWLRGFIAACNNYWMLARNLLFIFPKDQASTYNFDFHSVHLNSQHTNYWCYSKRDRHYYNISILDTRKDSCYIASPSFSSFHLHFLVTAMMYSRYQKYRTTISFSCYFPSDLLTPFFYFAYSGFFVSYFHLKLIICSIKCWVL